jgi:hypothetical protein
MEVNGMLILKLQQRGGETRCQQEMELDREVWDR